MPLFGQALLGRTLISKAISSSYPIATGDKRRKVLKIWQLRRVLVESPF